MRAELEAIVADFNLATDRLRALVHEVPESW